MIQLPINSLLWNHPEILSNILSLHFPFLMFWDSQHLAKLPYLTTLTIIQIYKRQDDAKSFSSVCVCTGSVESITACVFDIVSLIDQYGAQSTSSNALWVSFSHLCIYFLFYIMIVNKCSSVFHHLMYLIYAFIYAANNLSIKSICSSWYLCVEVKYTHMCCM